MGDTGKVDFFNGELFDYYNVQQWEFLPYYDEPKTDNERLMNMQKEFLTTGEKSAWDRLWTYALSVCVKICRSIYRRRKLPYRQTELEDRALDAAEYVLRRFKKNCLYCCKKNFVSELYLGCIHAFDYQQQTLTGQLEAVLVNVLNEADYSIDEAVYIAKKRLSGDK